MRSTILVTFFLILTTFPAYADTVTVPNVFSNGAVADANAVNANFSALASESNENDARIAAIENVRTPISSVPFTISASGSYYLTGNLKDLTNGEGITITASDVTLDLMGFTLTGTGTAHYGIEITGINTSIANGTIRAFGQAGIYGSNNGSRATAIRAIGNGTLGTDYRYTGIRLSGKDTYIERCLTVDNGGYGIIAGTNATVTNNITRSNGNTGLSVGAGTLVLNNTVVSNANDGIYVSSGALVANNTVMSNGQWGIYITGSSTIVKSNTVRDNNTSLSFLLWKVTSGQRQRRFLHSSL